MRSPFRSGFDIRSFRAIGLCCTNAPISWSSIRDGLWFSTGEVFDNLGFEQSDDGFGLCVVVAVSDTSGRHVDSGFGEPFGVSNGHLYISAVLFCSRHRPSRGPVTERWRAGQRTRKVWKGSWSIHARTPQPDRKRRQGLSTSFPRFERNPADLEFPNREIQLLGVCFLSDMDFLLRVTGSFV